LHVSEPRDPFRDPANVGDATPVPSGAREASGGSSEGRAANADAITTELGPEPERRPTELAPDDRAFVDTGRRPGMEWGNRCFLHLEAKRYDWARAACYKALELVRDDDIRGALYYNLGRVEENEGRPDTARWYYRRSLQARPGKASVLRRLEMLRAPGAGVER
jgi:tetratricopeptide (TPR) repeat protein